MMMAEEWCPGHVFNPAEEDIVGFYLKRAVMGMPLPSESAVRHVDVYGDRAPWEIFAEELARGSRLFFAITRLVKRSKGRMSRVVVSGGSRGTWKGQSVKREIKIGDVTAERYTLSFMKETNDVAASENTKKKKMASTHWNMVEYRVSSYVGGGEGDLDPNVVFCRLTYSGPQYQSSPVPCSTSSPAVGGSKRGRQEGDESISRPCKRAQLATQEQQQDGGVTSNSALNHQVGEAVGENDDDALAFYVEPAHEHGAAADEDDGYLHLINLDVAMDDDDGGPSNNTVEEICCYSSLQQQEPNQAAAQPAPAALVFQEVEDVDWAQINMQSNGGVIRSEDDRYLNLINFDVAMDDDDDGGPSDNSTEKIYNSSLQKQQQEPNQQSTIAATASSSQADGSAAAAAPAAPAALGFQEEDVDWAQICMHGGIFRPEETLDGDVDFSNLAAWLLEQEQHPPGVPAA